VIILKNDKILNKANKKKVMKKAMMVGQIFIFTLSLFIVVFILLYGYRVINNFIGSSSDVEMLQFRKNIENYVKSYSTEFGSVGYRDIPAPGNVNKLCFIDYYSQSSSLINCDTNPESIIHPVIKDSFIGLGTVDGERIGEMKNVFMIDVTGSVVNSDFFGNITVEGNSNVPTCSYLCINSFRGRFHLKIEGRGVGVRISDATP
jgi:hypothetical protein